MQTWDYASNGAYFITICTTKRRHYFGQIIDGSIELSAQGKIAHRFWLEIRNHFSFMMLDEFVIMPNHAHGTIIIDNPENFHAGIRIDATVEKGMPCLYNNRIHASNMNKQNSHTHVFAIRGKQFRFGSTL